MIIDIPASALAITLQDVAAQSDKVMLTNAQSSDITGKYCNTNGIQYDRDTYSVPTVLVAARRCSRTPPGPHGAGNANEKSGKSNEKERQGEGEAAQTAI